MRRAVCERALTESAKWCGCWGTESFAFGFPSRLWRGAKLDFVAGVVDEDHGAAEEKAVGLRPGVRGHWVAADVGIVAHHLRCSGKNRWVTGSDALYFNVGVVAFINP